MIKTDSSHPANKGCRLLESPPEILCKIVDDIEAPQDKISFTETNSGTYHAFREQRDAAIITLQAKHAESDDDYDAVLRKLDQKVQNKSLWAQPIAELIARAKPTTSKLPALVDKIEKMPLKARDFPLQSIYKKLADPELTPGLEDRHAHQKASRLIEEYEIIPAPILLARSESKLLMPLSEKQYLIEASKAYSSHDRSQILSNLAKKIAQGRAPIADDEAGIRLIIQAAQSEKISAEDRKAVCSELQETIRIRSRLYPNSFDDVKQELTLLEEI